MTDTEYSNLDLLLSRSADLSPHTLDTMELDGMHLGGGVYLPFLVWLKDEAGTRRSLPDRYRRIETRLRSEFSGSRLLYCCQKDGTLAGLFCFPHAADRHDRTVTETQDSLLSLFGAIRDDPAGQKVITLSGRPEAGLASIQYGYAKLREELEYLLFMDSDGTEFPLPDDAGTRPLNYDTDILEELAVIFANCILQQRKETFLDTEDRLFERLFSGPARSLRPVQYRLNIFLTEFSKALAVRRIIDPETEQKPLNFGPIPLNSTCREFRQNLHAFLQNMYTDTEVGRQGSQWERRMAHVMDYCQNHYKDQSLNVGQLSAVFGISQPQLSHMFKQHYDVNLLSLINSLRLEECRRLLRETDLPHTEIAASCGFSNTTTLQRLFRSSMDCSMREYRRRFRR